MDFTFEDTRFGKELIRKGVRQGMHRPKGKPAVGGNTTVQKQKE